MASKPYWCCLLGLYDLHPDGSVFCIHNPFEQPSRDVTCSSCPLTVTWRQGTSGREGGAHYRDCALLHVAFLLSWSAASGHWPASWLGLLVHGQMITTGLAASVVTGLCASLVEVLDMIPGAQFPVKSCCALDGFTIDIAKGILYATIFPAHLLTSHLIT